MPWTCVPSITVTKREPMVATSKPGMDRCAIHAATAARGSARSGAGKRLVRRGMRTSIASVTRPTSISSHRAVWRACT